jgi:crotonobetainyl-CoA:carnitine CoA-transferase CaiB-like acyl-CoA transferase
MAEILKGIKILDLSQAMAGPLCSMILGDLGADVIKIELPDGDSARSLGDTFLYGLSDYFLSLNRNKRSILVDLKKTEGREVIYRLAPKSDVFIENFRPGTVEKLGVDYKSISHINPKIVYCSISGFGQTGPYKNRPAMDPVIQAMGGLMGITGDPRTGPQKVGAPIADFVAPLLAVIGILGALRIRDKTDTGQKIEISMLDGVILSLLPRQAYYFIKGKSLPLLGNQHFQIAPCNRFRTNDGGYLMLIVHSQKHWKKFCESVERPDLINDQRFSKISERLKNIKTLNNIIQKLFIKRTQQEIIGALTNKGVMIAPVYTFDQLFEDPQVIHDNMLIELDHPVAGKIKTLRTFINLSRTPLKIKLTPPLLGEHTIEILSQFGFSEDEINQLRKSGAVMGG